MCILVSGFKLWNYLEIYFKCCSTIIQFKKMYHDQIIGPYELNE